MTDDLLDTIKAALDNHEAERCECYEAASNDDSPVCALLSATAVSNWLRALVARCEDEHTKAVQYELEAQTLRTMLQESETSITTLREDRNAWARLEVAHRLRADRAEADLAALRQRHAEAVGAWDDVKTEYANGHGLYGLAAPRLDAALASEAKARLT